MIFKTVCPNCRSRNFMETVSIEKCYDCGLECDYHGSGANSVYKNMMEEQAYRKELEHQEELDDWHRSYDEWEKNR